MKINIRPPAHAETKALVLSTQKKMKLFAKQHQQASEADIRFLHSMDQLNYKSCEIYLKIDGRNIFVIQKGESFDKAATKAIEKLNQQLAKLGRDAAGEKEAEALT